MKKLIWITVIIALIAAGGVLWYNRRAAATKTAAEAQSFDRVQVTRQDLDLVVSASGSVKLTHVVNVRPTVSGTVKQIYVKPGDRVRKGQALLQLDDLDLRRKVAQAKEALNYAKERLAKAKTDYALIPAQQAASVANAKSALASAEQKLTSLKQGLKPEEIDQLKSAVSQAIIGRDNAKADYNRMKGLFEAQAITQQDFDSAKTKYLTAEEAVTQAQKKLAAQTAPPDPADLAAAEAAVAQAKANLEVARQTQAAGNSADQVAQYQSALVQAQVNYDQAVEDLAGASLTAPVAGVVTDLVFKATSSNSSSALAVGDAVAAESGWVTIADTSLVEVHASVDETDIAKLTVGMAAKITADALDGDTFEGTVTNVAPSGVLSDGVVTFDVTITVVDRQGLLKAGMTTNADIMIAHHPNVLALPKEAVTERRGNPAVQVAVTGNRFRRVETGFSNDTYVEIVSGLEEGQTVLVARPAAQPNNGNGRNRQPGGFRFMGGR
ncbi:MAG: efflux RND transporter periplasmic adaptor subunit [Methanocella sp.]